MRYLLNLLNGMLIFDRLRWKKEFILRLWHVLVVRFFMSPSDESLCTSYQELLLRSHLRLSKA